MLYAPFFVYIKSKEPCFWFINNQRVEVTFLNMLLQPYYISVINNNSIFIRQNLL